MSCKRPAHRRAQTRCRCRCAALAAVLVVAVVAPRATGFRPTARWTMRHGSSSRVPIGRQQRASQMPSSDRCRRDRWALKRWEPQKTHVRGIAAHVPEVLFMYMYMSIRPHARLSAGFTGRAWIDQMSDVANRGQIWILSLDRIVPC